MPTDIPPEIPQKKKSSHGNLIVAAVAIVFIIASYFTARDDIISWHVNLQGKPEHILTREAMLYERSLDIRSLVVDLSGKGINLSTHSVMWDINTNGFLNSTKWTGAGTGFIATDINNNGIIDDHSEILGDKSSLTGFDELASYDTNSDGVIDEQDSSFSKLVIWYDANLNGRGEKDELHSMESIGIRSISLRHDVLYDWMKENNGKPLLDITKNRKKSEDSIISARGYATLADGSYMQLADVKLNYHNGLTWYNRPYKLNPVTMHLPNLRGYGHLPHLHISMSLDGNHTNPDNLLRQVIRFSQLSFGELFTDDNAALIAVENILYRWAKADTLDPASRGENIDARRIAFTEATAGEEWRQLGIYPNPRPDAGHMINQAFLIAVAGLGSRLMLQGEGSKLFLGKVSYNPLTDRINGIQGINNSALEYLMGIAANAEYTKDPFVFWVNVTRFIDNTAKLKKTPAPRFGRT